MKKGLRNTGIIAVVFLGACAVQVGDIQRTEPIRKATFTGSHVAVAQCIQLRLRPRLVETGEPFTSRETFVFYDRNSRYSRQGMSHYSMTVKKTGPNAGIVEWRVISQQGHPLDQSFAAKFLAPVERCLDEARKTS